MPAPAYVDLPGSATYPQPYSMDGAVARVFLLEADLGTLQKSVDASLNVPINNVYKYVALPLVAMITMPIARVASIDGTGCFAGYAEENDVAFAMLLAASRIGTNVVDHFAVDFPFVLVDNPITMSSGREVFGFRKSLGTYEFFPGTSMPIVASTPVVTRAAPDAMLEMKEVMRMGGVIDGLAEEAQGHSLGARIEQMLAEGLEWAEDRLELDADELVEDLAGAIAPNDLFREFVKALLTFRKVNCAFLLQLRDCALCTTATYQALVEMPMRIKSINAMPQTIARPTIVLGDYLTYPVVSQLGLRGTLVDGDATAGNDTDYEVKDSKYNVQPKLAFEVAIDFELMSGRIIVEAMHPPIAD